MAVCSIFKDVSSKFKVLRLQNLGIKSSGIGMLKQDVIRSLSNGANHWANTTLYFFQ